MSTHAATWPIGSTLELAAKKCGFPKVTAPPADPAQPYQSHVTSDAPFILHSPERVRLIRHMDTQGKHILCHHSSGVFFLSSSHHFSLLPL